VILRGNNTHNMVNLKSDSVPKASEHFGIISEAACI